jgi:hypothetical protein
MLLLTEQDGVSGLSVGGRADGSVSLAPGSPVDLVTCLASLAIAPAGRP